MKNTHATWLPPVRVSQFKMAGGDNVRRDTELFRVYIDPFSHANSSRSLRQRRNLWNKIYRLLIILSEQISLATETRVWTNLYVEIYILMK